MLSYSDLIICKTFKIPILAANYGVFASQYYEFFVMLHFDEVGNWNTQAIGPFCEAFAPECGIEIGY